MGLFVVVVVGLPVASMTISIKFSNGIAPVSD